MLQITAFGKSSVISLEGEDHLERRRILAPEFTPKAIELQKDSILALIENELNKIDTSQEVDIVAFMKKITAKIICVVILGISVEDEEMNEIAELVNIMEINLGNLFNDQSNFIRTARNFVKVRQAIGKIRIFLGSKLKEAQASLITSNERLDLLHKIALDKSYTSQHQRVDDLMIMFFAGHETTATELSWIVYYLLQEKNAHYLEKVQNESRGEELARYVELEKVILEAMRLVPPIANIYRETMKATIVTNNDGENILIPIGTKILIDIEYINAHISTESTEGLNDDSILSDLDFNPSRFDDPDTLKLFLSKGKTFGDGAKRCLGETLARVEMMHILRKFFQEFNVKFVDSTTQRLSSKGIVTKMDPENLPIFMERISKEA